MAEIRIAYEPHPVSPERKKELRDLGFKILDIKFKPEGEPEDEPENDVMSKSDIMQALDELGIEYDGRSKESKLRDLLRDASS